MKALVAAAICFFLLVRVAIADPTSADACEYFGRDLEIRGKVAAPAFDKVQFGPFKEIAINLERYAILRKDGTPTEFGIIRKDGVKVITGLFSASVLCSVDVKDRRVFQISVIDGPDAGKATKLADGSDRIIQGAAPENTVVATKIHQGKY